MAVLSLIHAGGRAFPAFVLLTYPESVWLWPSFSLSDGPSTDSALGRAPCLPVGPDNVPRPAGDQGPGEDPLEIPRVSLGDAPSLVPSA